MDQTFLESSMLEQEQTLRDRASTSRVPEEVLPTAAEREESRRRHEEPLRRGDEAMAYLGRNRELRGEGGPADIRRGDEARANFQSSGEESGLGMLRSAGQPGAWQPWAADEFIGPGPCNCEPMTNTSLLPMNRQGKARECLNCRKLHPLGWCVP
jgi:hypothetical protein